MSVHQLDDQHLGNEQLLELFAQYQQARGLARTTIARRRYSLSRLAVMAAPLALVDVSPVIVEEWLAGYPSAHTRHAYLADVRALFRWASRRRLAPSDPTADFERMVAPVPLPNPIGDADWRASVDNADPRVRLVLLFGGLAGLRRAEIAAMAREDCTAEVLVVRCGKGGRPGRVVMHPVLWEAIQASGISRGWFFPSPEGGHVRPGTVGRWIRHHFDTLAVSSTLHKTRHRFATAVARESNGNPFALKQALRWARLATAEHYVTYDSAEVARIIRRLPA